MATESKPDLKTLTASAAKAYSLKNYTEAADLYAQACELQTELHDGKEDDPRNADLLYLYGKALYQVALLKSDVLGGPAAEKKDEKKEGKKAGLESVKEDEEPAKKTGAIVNITGDENFDTDDEEMEDADGEGEEEEEDDLNSAWDVLDLARVLFGKRLDAATDDETKTKTKTVLADNLDLLGELSLESENFAQASEDFLEALKLKKELYPIESPLLPEAHYKLALAYEFSAEGEDISAEGRKQLREKAACEIEAAIAGCQARIEKEEAGLAPAEDKGKGKASVEEEEKQKEIENVKGMVGELEAKLKDLRDESAAPEVPDEDPLKGLLAQVMGKAPAEARKMINEAMGQANDLTGLVRKKEKKEEKAVEKKEEVVVEKKEEAPVEKPVASSNGKRKADEVVVESFGDGSKKARVEEVADAES